MALGINIEPNEDLPGSLDTSFLRNDDKINRWGNVVSSFSTIPGLVGFWPMSSVQRSTGNAFDLSGQGRTLTYNGAPTYNIEQDFTPYINFGATADSLSRPDETDLDIIGTETIYDSSVRGLTMGGWFRGDRFESALFELPMGKVSNVAGQFSYFIIKDTALDLLFRISTDGTALVSVTSSISLLNNTWYFIVGRFIPSTELAIFVSTTKNTFTTAIPATIFNSAANFSIGRITGVTGADMRGRASLCFLSANALSDALINGLFQQSRVLFGV